MKPPENGLRSSQTRWIVLTVLPLIFVVALIRSTAEATAGGPKTPDNSWTSEFRLDPAELAATGRNPYFILEPGYQLVFEGEGTVLTITVLPDTKTLGGIVTRVIEERESEAGELVEVSRNFFAIDTHTNSVYYFGEDVDLYGGGKVTGHEGSWLAGTAGARFGLMMPGLPLLGARYYQEIAAGTALDRAEIVGLAETVQTPAGKFQDCLKVEETTSLEPDVKEYKWYAPGIGLVRDGSLKLAKYGKLSTSKK